MSDYTRRPFLSSQTDKIILSQPEIFGTVHINLDGEYDDMPASGTVELAIQTESTTSPTIETQQWDAAADDVSLAGIVEAINDPGSPLYPYVKASAYEGVLCLASKQSGFISAGNPSFLTIHPQTSGALVTDLGPIVGFALAPHPAATVTAGDLPAASVRAMTQGNRPGSAFIARGEDRTGENFNRALHALALNLDIHQVKLIREVAVPVVLEIPEGSARYRTDASTGRILGVELTSSYGDDLDGVLENGIYIGGPAFDASVHEIAKFYSVLDTDWNEISVVSHDDPGPGDVKDTVVRVGTVAYIPSSPPGVYSDSDFELDGSARVGSSLSNNAVFDSYRSVLADPSNQPVKSTSVITSVIDGATVVCSTATFVTDLVEEGDIAIISSSAVSSPINHDGEYIVDVVVSETELVLRPVDEDSAHLLNNDGLGNIEIRPNGQFETSLYLAFEPPLPRVPSGGIKIVLGMQDGFGDMSRDFALVPAVNSAEEVDGWVLKNLYRAFNLQGIYDGQGQDKGSGFHADFGARGLAVHTLSASTSPASVRTGASGTIQDGSNWFTIGAGDEFTTADVGRSLTFTLSGTEYHDWRVSRLIDARTVKLVPPPHQIGTVLTAGSVSAWELYDNMLPDFRAAVNSVTQQQFGGGFHHTKVNDGEVSADLSFAHFEHITEFASLGTAASPVTRQTLSGALSGDTVTFASVNVDDCPSIFPTVAHASSRRNDNVRGGITFMKVLTGEDLGLYQVYSTRISGVGSIVKVLNLEGQAPSFAAGTHDVAFYTLRAGFGVPLFGGETDAGRAALSLFEDGVQKGGNAYALRATWAGPGAGVFVVANDSSFEALMPTATDKGAVGPSMKVIAYAPAYGAEIEVRGDSTQSSDVGRGQYGVNVLVETYAHDLTQPDSGWSSTLGFRGGGVNVVQEGLDPAGAFVRRAGGGGGLTLLYPSALYVASLGEIDHVGAATGMTLVGDLYAPGHQTAGIYTGGTGTFNELRPGYTDMDVEPPNFWGDGAAWLGSPYLVADVASVTVSGPDYSRFNFDHDFVVDLTRSDAPSLDSRTPSEIVHLGVKLDFGGTPFGGTILGVWDNGSGVYRLAIKAQNGASHTTGTHDFKAYGRRWFYSYIDIANYSEIGTGVIAPYQDPGSSQTSYSVSTSSVSAVMPAVDQSQDGAGGLRPLITYDVGDGTGFFSYGRQSVLVPSGSGLGDLFSPFSFGLRAGENVADYATIVASIDARSEADWENLAGAFTSSIDGHVSRAQSEIGAAAPFVEGAVPAKSVVDMLRYEMSWDADAALTSAHVEVVPNDGTSQFGPWSYVISPHFAGGGSKIVASRERGDADSGNIYLYLKLARSIVEGNLAFRVLVDALQYSTGSSTMLLEIVEGHGSGATVMAAKSIEVPSGTTYDRYVVDFLEWSPEEDLVRSANTFLRVSLEIKADNHTDTDSDTFMGDGTVVPPLWYLRGINVHALENLLVKGNLALQGILRTAGVRSLSPILGHQVVGPTGVRLLQENGYAYERGEASSSSYTRNRPDNTAFYPRDLSGEPYAPRARETGSQEGTGVGVLPIFELIDSQDELGAVIPSGGEILRVEGPLNPKIGETVWAERSSLREISLTASDIQVLFDGIWAGDSGGNDWMAYTAGTYNLFAYSGMDFYGGNNPYTVGVSNGAGALARWCYVGYNVPYLSFSDGSVHSTEGAAESNPSDPDDSNVVVAIGNVGAAVRYYRPSFDGSRFFQVGRNSAAIDGYHPYFDPFFYWWYCFQSAVNRLSDEEKELIRTTFNVTGGDFWNDVDPDGAIGSYQRNSAYADPSVNPDFWDMPGRTGFIGQLDPPHGSLLTKVEIRLSIKPADGRSIVSSGSGDYSTHLHWGVWRSAPDKDAPRSEWVDADAWKDREGVIVRLWRHNLFGEMGSQPENTTATNLGKPPSGYAELLGERELDLSETNPGSLTQEQFFDVEVDVGSTVGSRVVDRRRFSYFFTVEFYVGCRRRFGDDLLIPGLSVDESEQGKRTSPLTWTTAFPDLWPTALGQLGEWRVDGTVGYHRAVSWEGHLVNRRYHTSDHKSVILPGSGYYYGHTIDFTLTTTKVTSVSTLAPSGYQILRSVYDASAFLRATSSGGYEGLTTVLPYRVPGGELYATPSPITQSSDESATWMAAPLDATDRADCDPVTPVVKFRGARLTWVTDRLSDGGW